MRTDVVASSRPRKAGAAPLNRGSSRAWRRLSVVPVALLLAAALLGPGTAIAAEPTTGCSQTAPTPKTTPSTPSTTTPKTTPTTGTSPSKEEKTGEKTTPSKETAPSTSSSATPTKEKASTLPFTGLDVRWAVGVGLLLLAAGFSITVVDRRHRRRAGR